MTNLFVSTSFNEMNELLNPGHSVITFELRVEGGHQMQTYANTGEGVGLIHCERRHIGFFN